MSMDEQYAEILQQLGATDWDYAEGFLICPCGDQIEDDGRCPEGCVSPFVEAGII